LWEVARVRSFFAAPRPGLLAQQWPPEHAHTLALRGRMRFLDVLRGMLCYGLARRHIR